MAEYHHLNKELPEILGCDDWKELFQELGQFAENVASRHKSYSFAVLIKEYALYHLGIERVEEEDKASYDRILRAFGV